MHSVDQAESKEGSLDILQIVLKCYSVTFLGCYGVARVNMFIICLSFVHNFPCQVYIKCGTKSRERFVDLKKVAAVVGHDICSALSGMHSFTGCDTVSTFGGKCTVSALKLMQKTRKYQELFTKLGKEWSITRDLFNVLQEFTCKLYANKCPSITVNELRFLLFRAKKGEVESGQLPPCEDVECRIELLSSIPRFLIQVVMGGSLKMGNLRFAG